MYNRFFFSASVVFYNELNAFGYNIYARTVNEPFLLIVSPGAYVAAADAIKASEVEILNLKNRLQARDARRKYTGSERSYAS